MDNQIEFFHHIIIKLYHRLNSTSGGEDPVAWKLSHISYIKKFTVGVEKKKKKVPVSPGIKFSSSDKSTALSPFSYHNNIQIHIITHIQNLHPVLIALSLSLSPPLIPLPVPPKPPSPPPSHLHSTSPLLPSVFGGSIISPSCLPSRGCGDRECA